MTGSFAKTIEYGKRFFVQTDPNVISDAGIEDIRNYISRANLRNTDWRSILPEDYDPYDYQKDRLPELPSEWDWTINSNSKIPIDGKKYNGRFTRRVSAYMHHKIGISVPEDWLTQLGNIASSHSEKNASYYIDFTKDLHSWTAGDFGDRGSCFWSGRENARNVMEKNGCFAIRFYQSDDPKAKGIARAWVTPDCPEDGLAVVWNGYGYSGDPTRIIARVLMTHLKLDHYRLVTLKNNDRSDGDVYINGSRGVIIGDVAKSTKYTRVDFKWNERILGRCPHCDEIIHASEEYDDNVIEHEGRYYHSNCFHEMFFSCEICGSHHRNSNAHSIEKHSLVGGWINMTVCPNCFATHSHQCESCERNAHSTSVRIVDGDGTILCNDCYTEETCTCDICNTMYMTGSLRHHPVTHEEVCECCYDDISESIQQNILSDIGETD